MPKKSEPKTSKTAVKPPAEQNKPQVVGPGVVKRPKREVEETATKKDEQLDYTPSEQVFRRR